VVTTRLVSFPAPALAGWEWPVIEVVGSADGPVLLVTAGVHGCEYSSIEAARRFAATLDSDRLAGRVVVLPVVNVPAFWGRTPFVVPVDGKNLNRCFPGDPEGSFAEALAHEIFERYVRVSDALLDLHGAGAVHPL
jgi:predicted deacylase